MSYEIEYNRLFLKTNSGYIPLILIGSNNVWENGKKKRERRAREWTILSKEMLNKPENELEAIAKSWSNQFDEHWKKNGKFLTNEGLIRWIHSGCKSACSIEDFLFFNPVLFHVSFFVYHYDSNGTRHEDLSAEVKTTDELEKWVVDAKQFVADSSDHCYYGVRSLPEIITHPPIGDENDQFAFKTQHGYFYGLGMFGSSPASALIRPIQKWREIIEGSSRFDVPFGTFEKIVDKARFTKKGGYVIKVTINNITHYVSGYGTKACHYYYSKMCAKVYTTKESAERVIGVLEHRFPALCNSLSVEAI